MPDRDIADNLRRVQDRIAEAADRVGRDADEVNVIAVTKTRPLDEIRAAVDAGATDLGENYVQEMVEKAEALECREARWHAIGHLQTNKVRDIADFVSLIHSVDSVRVGEEIDRRAEEAGRPILFLLQVNVSGEDSKFGVPPEEAPALAHQLEQLDHSQLIGLMTMPPYCEEPDENRPYFVRLRQLRDELIESGIDAERLRHLSMGMTCDFEVAVEEGATFVRVGTAIFGPRH